MNKRILTAIALTLALVMALSGCTYFDAIFGSIFKGPQVELTDAPLNAEKLVDFTQEVDPSVLFESDGWSNGDVFNVVWKSHNVVYENGIMRLGITEESATAYLDGNEVAFNYTAGEARTQNYYHYGDYEVSMKPSANPGTASTFFVCTGPYDEKTVTDAEGNTTKVPNAHDEIDIEFLGKDTTKVQFNFFVDGQGGNEYMYDLGFDASKEFHKYGFRWTETSITWFVDGVPVYKVTTDKTATGGTNLRVVDKLPSTAGRMLTNYWCGNERAWGWMGEYKGAVNDNGTEYQWIATSAEGAPLNPPTQNPDNPPVGDAEINWADIAPIAPEFPSADPYVVAVDGNKATVTYTDVSGSAYMPIELDVTDAVAGKNYVYLKVTNNGTETVNVRVNMFDPTLTGNNKATNISATMNGEAVRTDLDWGGSFFDIPAGETAELVVNFGVGGVKLQLMIDSSRNDSTLRSGNVTVEDIKFAAVGEVITPPPACEHVDANTDGKCDNCDETLAAPAPTDPVSGDLSTTIDGVEVTFDGNKADGYGVNANDENNTVNIIYTNVVGNSYKNVWANVSSIAATKTAFTVTVTNNGTSPVKFRIDIESATQVNANTTACNLSATQDGNNAFTDLEWGGSTFEIAAGATSVLVVNYDASKTPTNIKFFVDSCQWDDETAHAGDITLSAMGFTGEYVPEQGGDDPVDPPVDPVVPVLPELPTDGEYVKFAGNDTYTIVADAEYVNKVQITYSAISTNSWHNVNAYIADKAAGKNNLNVTLRNNGTAPVLVSVKLEAAGAVELAIQKIELAAGEMKTVSLDFNGVAEMLFFFIDSDWSETTTTHAGDISIAGIKFSGEATSTDPTDPVDPVVPVLPELPTDGEYVKFAGNDTYTIVADAEYVNKVQITYSAISTNSWHNVNAYIADKAAGKNNLNVTLRNNGTAPVLVSVKLEAAGAVELAIQKIELAAGEMKTVSLDFNGVAEMLFFFIDSDWSETTTTHAGDISIAGIKFSGEAAPAAPVLPNDGEYVKFEGSTEYVSNTQDYANIIGITYSGVDKDSYKCINTWVQDKATGKTSVTFTVRNNGTETVGIMVKVQTVAEVAKGEDAFTVAAGETKTFTLNYTDTPDMFFLFIDSAWNATAGTHSGDITIAGIKFQ